MMLVLNGWIPKGVKRHRKAGWSRVPARAAVAQQDGRSKMTEDELRALALSLPEPAEQETGGVAAREVAVAAKAPYLYEAGVASDFYDPDGPGLVPYRPSGHARSWPSREPILAMRASTGEPPLASASASNGMASGAAHDGAVATHDLAAIRADLDGSPIIPLFQFASDSDTVLPFYYEGLGLTALEGEPCSRTSGGDEEGVLKYKAGGLILSTHLCRAGGPRPRPRLPSAHFRPWAGEGGRCRLRCDRHPARGSGALGRGRPSVLARGMRSSARSPSSRTAPGTSTSCTSRRLVHRPHRGQRVRELLTTYA